MRSEKRLEGGEEGWLGCWGRNILGRDTEKPPEILRNRVSDSAGLRWGQKLRVSTIAGSPLRATEQRPQGRLLPGG